MLSSMFIRELIELYIKISLLVTEPGSGDHLLQGKVIACSSTVPSSLLVNWDIVVEFLLFNLEV